MKQKVVLVTIIIAIVGLGAGLAGGILITNSKSKAAIADMQSKMEQSEASSQARIRTYENIVNQLTGELQLAKFQIETLKTPAPEAAAEAAENEMIAAAPVGSSISETTKQYTIKSGDSLWSIAQKQLGDGNRFKEILKLNPRISAKSTLTVGAKLNIPAR